MKRRRPSIPTRKPIFLGCEGDSEVAYGQVLYALVRDARIPVHLQITPLSPGAGDPLARVQRAMERIAQYEKNRTKLHSRFVFVDSDQAKCDPKRAEAVRLLAAEARINIIWQDPCHEGLLLRHMPNQLRVRPSTSILAERKLVRVWPEYEKPMSRADVAKRIGINEIRRAATVEPGVRAFLLAIGLLP